jgi:hypothetical protein
VKRLSKQTLPQESATVFINGAKQTFGMSRDTRLSLALSEAEKFYCAPVMPNDNSVRRSVRSGLGLSKSSFNAVAWESLDNTLHNKPQLYRQWILSNAQVT